MNICDTYGRMITEMIDIDTIGIHI